MVMVMVTMVIISFLSVFVISCWLQRRFMLPCFHFVLELYENYCDITKLY